MRFSNNKRVLVGLIDDSIQYYLVNKKRNQMKAVERVILLFPNVVGESMHVYETRDDDDVLSPLACLPKVVVGWW